MSTMSINWHLHDDEEEKLSLEISENTVQGTGRKYFTLTVSIGTLNNDVTIYADNLNQLTDAVYKLHHQLECMTYEGMEVTTDGKSKVIQS